MVILKLNASCGCGESNNDPEKAIQWAKEHSETKHHTVQIFGQVLYTKPVEVTPVRIEPEQKLKPTISAAKITDLKKLINRS